MFFTYGDTDEPDITVQRDEIYAEIQRLAERISMLELLFGPAPSVSGGEHHPDDEARSPDPEKLAQAREYLTGDRESTITLPIRIVAAVTLPPDTVIAMVPEAITSLPTWPNLSDHDREEVGRCCALLRVLRAADHTEGEG